MASKTIKIRRRKLKGCSRPLSWEPHDAARRSQRPNKESHQGPGRKAQNEVVTDTEINSTQS